MHNIFAGCVWRWAAQLAFIYDNTVYQNAGPYGMKPDYLQAIVRLTDNAPVSPRRRERTRTLSPSTHMHTTMPAPLQAAIGAAGLLAC